MYRLPGELTSHRSRVKLAVVAFLAVAATVATGVAGGPGAVGLFGGAATLVVFASRRVATPEDRRFLVTLALLALLARVLVAAVLDLVLVARGREGALFEDDWGYIRIAADLARNWRGEPVAVATDPSLMHSYVEMAGLLFFAFGKNVLALKLVNVTFGTLAGVLTYRTMVNLRLPGARWGALLMLGFPSLFLWSVTALKDSFSLGLTVMCVWTVSEYLRSRRPAWYLGTIATLVVLESVRRYVMLILSFAWPVSLLFVAMRPWHKVRSVLGAAAAVALLFLWVQPWEYTASGGLAAITFTRASMAQYSRTAFVQAQPIIAGSPGEHFQIAVLGAPTTCGERRVIEVQPGTELVIADSMRAAALRAAPPSGRVVLVRACDIVRIIEPSLTPGPLPTATPTLTPQVPIVVLEPEAQNVVGAPIPPPPPDSEAISLAKDVAANLVHLPVGVLYLIGAPVPGTGRTPGELATIPEMLAWYVSLALAVAGALHLVRRRQFEYAFGALTMLGIGLILSLIEGNVGTLVRHRSMVITFVVVFAAVGFDRSVWPALQRAIVTRRARHAA